MGKPSPRIMDFMSKYKVDSDEIWEVHGNTWVMKHKALERVAVEQGVTWDAPTMIETSSKDGIVAMVVFGSIKDRREWSVGEASPKNNKNQYPYAMAEKRGKDRVILKLLEAHGILYSEEEADDFKASSKPTSLPKKDAKGIYEKLQHEIRQAPTRELLKQWGNENKDRIEVLPEDWQDILRLQYEEQLADLRNQEVQ